MASTNTALLRAARLLAPPGISVDIFAGLGQLPYYNPDLDGVEDDLPPAVAAFRTLVGASDGLLVACPEYAHGVPGAFKNALDWLVSGPEFPGKPIAMFSATTRGTHARAALVDTMQTMSGVIIAEASISLPLVGKTIAAADLVADPEFADLIRSGLGGFAEGIYAMRHEAASESTVVAPAQEAQV